MYDKVVQQRLGYLTFFKTLFKKMIFLTILPWTKSYFSSGVSLKAFIFQNTIFRVSTTGLHIHYLMVVSIPYAGYGFANTKF